MASSLVERLSIDRSDQQLRLRWIGITDEDTAAIRAAAPFLKDHVDSIVRQFYDHSASFPQWTAKVAESGSQRAILERAQKAYLERLLEGRIDESYFEHRLRVGERHAKLNVEPRWNLGNYGVYAKLVYPLLAKKFKGERLARTIIAFEKLFVLDMTLAIETYISEGVLEKLVDMHTTLGAPLVELQSSTSQLDAATREIASAVQQIAQGASSQTDAMVEAQQDMRRLVEAGDAVQNGAQRQATTVETARAASGQVRGALGGMLEAAAQSTESGKQSLAAADEGLGSARQTSAAMSEIRAAVTATAQEVRDLGDRGNEIGDIVKVIDEIASQTNLLALNAAIEAARAGDQGRGFAVVAENVRALAERTSVATKEIAALIKAVQDGTQRAVAAMGKSLEQVEGGTERAEVAAASLAGIVESVKAVNGGIRQMETEAGAVDAAAREMETAVEELAELARNNSSLATEMGHGAQRVVEALSTAAAVAEETAAASQEVSASVEEVSAQVSELASQTGRLASTTEEMSTFIDRFGVLAHDSSGRPFSQRELKKSA